MVQLEGQDGRPGSDQDVPPTPGRFRTPRGAPCNNPPGAAADICHVPLAIYARYAYDPLVEFEWDPVKSAATARNRGIDFVRAAEIFTGRLVEWPDDRRPYGEARVRAVGASGGDVLHVVYTRRGAVIRIISARRASRKERAQWLSSG